MFNNYLKMVVRHMVKYKVYSVFNIFGLAIGLAATMLILLYIQFEFSFDRFHKNVDQIYRISVMSKKEGKFVSDSPVFVDPLGPALKKDLPEVEEFVRISTQRSAYFYHDNKSFRINSFCHADSSLFTVFSFSLIKGDARSALSLPNSIVLSEPTALAIFGDQNPLGKFILLDNRIAYQVSGIVKAPPANSHIQFEALVSFSTLYQDKNYYMGWNGGNQYINYIKLSSKTSANEVEAKLPDLMWEYINKDLAGIGIKYEPYLQPLKDIHLHYTSDFGLIVIYIFGVVVALVLIIACINFINLTTALSSTRAKEVGVRKVLGAQRGTIIRQFLIESFLVCLMAFAVALVMVQLFLPKYFTLVGTTFPTSNASLAQMSAMVVFITSISILAGAYPAFFLANFSITRTLRGSSNFGRGKAAFRNILVVIQFAIAIVLFISTILINRQLNFMQNMELGFNNENIIVVPLFDEKIKSKCEVLKNELSQLPEVKNVTCSSDVPFNGFTSNGYFPEGSNSPHFFHVVEADEDFLATFKIELVQGRNFSDQFAADKNAYLINETLAHTLLWDQPVGKLIRRDGEHPIIGVVKDFNFSSLHDKIEPLIISNNPWNGLFNVISIKAQSKDMAQTIASIERIFKKTERSTPFEYWFLDEAFEFLYRSEQRFQQILFYFSCLAITIALFGLFSLASFSIEKRTKEIGIRKILGCSVIGIVTLISKDFLKLVFRAFLIASPIAWLFITKWLQIFAYRINVDLQIFIFAGCWSLLVALITVGYRSIKAGLANPIKSIRYE